MKKIKISQHQWDVLYKAATEKIDRYNTILIETIKKKEEMVDFIVKLEEALPSNEPEDNRSVARNDATLTEDGKQNV